MKKLLMISASILSMSVVSAAASTVYETIFTQGHRGLQSTGGSLDYTSAGGVTLSASAHQLVGQGFGDALRLGEYSNGLGVTSPPITLSKCVNWNGHVVKCGSWMHTKTVDYTKYDSHLVDGYLSDEIVKLSFDKTVTLEKVYFTYEDWNDDFEFLMVDGDRGGEYFEYQNVYDVGSYGLYSFNQEWTGTMFGIGARGWNDEWKLAGVKFSYEEHIDVVPLPAAGWMLLAGVGGLVAMRRRKQAA